MPKPGTVFDSSISQYNIQYAPCRCVRGFAGKRLFGRVTIVFMFEPKRPLTTIARRARVLAGGNAKRPGTSRLQVLACNAAASLGTNLFTQNIFLLPFTTTTSP